MSWAVTTQVKLGGLGKSAIRSWKKVTVFNVHKFFKDVSGQPEYFSNKNVRIKWKKGKEGTILTV
jgi:hypothetical protein